MESYGELGIEPGSFLLQSSQLRHNHLGFLSPALLWMRQLLDPLYPHRLVAVQLMN